MNISVAADLHLHTTASDGSWTALELVDKALSLGLKTISITDHDTVDGLLALETVPNRKLEIIAGIELSAEHEGEEIHILGYGVDLQSPDLRQKLEELQADRVARIIAMIERLDGLGYKIEFATVKRLAGEGSIGRVHLAQALIEAGHISSISEGFSRFLALGAPAYVPREKMTPQLAIDLIKSVNGVSVLAHPGLIKNKKIIGEIISLGLTGLEVIHPSHDQEQTMILSQLVKIYDLVPTGGSDCHGPFGKDQILIGSHVISDEWVQQLKSKM